jgi:hypothetical protein
MRHPLHSICPYFAMFPEDFVAKQVLAYTKRGDVVFDPFSGRGTTVFESLLNGRNAAGVDINPVAACIAGAKADPPRLRAILKRLAELEGAFKKWRPSGIPTSEFFEACFHRQTLAELVFLRSILDWKNSKIDRFIAAVSLGCLHGESHKSMNCFSNRMPRTISTKPEYSVKWWKANGSVAEKRSTFDILVKMSAYRLAQPLAPLKGSVKLRDARRASSAFLGLRGAVKLVVTSPPYLDTTDYSEDQWLRLWFLGGPERPFIKTNLDDRHTSAEEYWRFLSEAWGGCSGLLMSGSVIVIRIGGTRLTKDDLYDGVLSSLSDGLSTRLKALDYGSTTEIKNRQTNSFRPGTKSVRFEHDFVFQLC